MKVQPNLWGIGLFLFLAGLAFPGAAPGAELKIVRLESRTFPNPIVWDSNYTACLAASDGRVYVGLNYHGGGAGGSESATM